MKICVAAGTRPEWIKMAPIIHELENRNLNYFILNTGQHYSSNMVDIFFEQLKLPEARYNLGVGSSTHGRQTAQIITESERIFTEERPDVVLVEGDTNSVLGVAIAAVKLGIRVGHVEAGLRSRDRTMPEELNRIMVDHISECLFAPTELAKNNLIKEGIPRRKIWVTGNTIVDTLYMNEVNIKSKKKKNLIVITLHRQENTDDPNKLKMFLETLNSLQQELPTWDKVFVAHPRTIRKILEFGLTLPRSVRILDSMGYFEFLSLVKSAKLVLTDSGGVQEEACILGTPCVTLRDSTERPESIQVGANLLAGVDPSIVMQMVREMLNHKDWVNPFGDGKAGKRIIDILSGGAHDN